MKRWEDPLKYARDNAHEAIAQKRNKNGDGGNVIIKPGSEECKQVEPDNNKAKRIRGFIPERGRRSFIGRSLTETTIIEKDVIDHLPNPAPVHPNSCTFEESIEDYNLSDCNEKILDIFSQLESAIDSDVTNENIWEKYAQNFICVLEKWIGCKPSIAAIASVCDKFLPLVDKIEHEYNIELEKIKTIVEYQKHHEAFINSGLKFDPQSKQWLDEYKSLPIFSVYLDKKRAKIGKLKKDIQDFILKFINIRNKCLNVEYLKAVAIKIPRDKVKDEFKQG